MTSLDLNISVISSEEEFSSLSAEWTKLWEQSTEATPFQSFEWMFHWWQAYQGKRSLRIVKAVSPSGELLGLLPLTLRKAKRYRISYSELTLLGDGSYETDHTTFLVRHNEDAQNVVFALLDFAHTHLDWDLFSANQMLHSNVGSKLLLRWATERDLRHVQSLSPCPTQIFPSSYEEFLKSLKPRMRTQLRSVRRKLSEEYALVEFGEVKEEVELTAAIEELFVTHQSRWTALGEPGSFSWPERKTFYRLFAPALWKAGGVRLFFLKLNDKVIAHEFCLQRGRKVFLLQEGFFSEFAAKSVGHALRSHIFEQCIQDGIEAYDFLSGDARHKRAWSNAEVLDEHVTIFRKNTKGQFFRLLPSLLSLIKEGLGRLLPEAIFKRMILWKQSVLPESDRE